MEATEILRILVNRLMVFAAVVASLKKSRLFFSRCNACQGGQPVVAPENSIFLILLLSSCDASAQAGSEAQINHGPVLSNT